MSIIILYNLDGISNIFILNIFYFIFYYNYYLYLFISLSLILNHRKMGTINDIRNSNDKKPQETYNGNSTNQQ